MPRRWQASWTRQVPAIVSRITLTRSLAVSEPSTLSAYSGPTGRRPRMARSSLIALTPAPLPEGEGRSQESL